MVAQACDPSTTPEVEAGGQELRGHSWLHREFEGRPGMLAILPERGGEEGEDRRKGEGERQYLRG